MKLAATKGAEAGGRVAMGELTAMAEQQEAVMAELAVELAAAVPRRPKASFAPLGSPIGGPEGPQEFSC